MKERLQVIRRKQLWRLLLGVLGGAVCSELWAAGLQTASGLQNNPDDVAPVLRMSLLFGERNKPKRGKAGRQPGIAAVAPLRLIQSLELRNLAAAGAPAPRGQDAASDSRVAGRAVMAPIGSFRRGGDGGSGDGPVQPEAPVPFDPTPVGGAPRRPAGADKPAVGKTAAGQSELPDLGGESWGIAPIRWSGNTGTSGNSFGAGDGSKSLSIANTLNIQANSFIVAPYIANWSGVFGLNSANSRFTPSIGPGTKSENSGSNVGATVNVFPLSLFPFSANFGYGTSEAKAGESRQPATNTNLGLRQQYRTADGRDNYTASYNRNSFSSGGNSSQTSSLHGNFSTRRVVDFDHFLEGDHTLNASVAYSPSSSDGIGQKSRLLNANLSHGWKVHEDLSISNVLTLASNQLERFQGNALTRNDSNVLLGATTFNWRPFEDMPLTLAGGGNIGQTQTGGEGEQVTQQNAAAYVSGNYRFNNNLSAAGNASFAATSSKDVRNTSVSTGATVSYSGDPLKFGSFIYGWGVAGGATSFVSSFGSSSFGASISANHNLVRTIVIDETQAINLNAGQSVSHNQVQSGPASSLSNNLGAAWRAAYGDALTVNLSANLADNISTGESGTNHYRSMSLMGNGLYQVSSRAALTLNANLSWNQTQSPGTSAQPQIVNEQIVGNRQTQMTGTFSLGYTHFSPFSIRNLAYNASLIWINTQSNQLLAGADPLAGQSQSSASLQQTIDYRVGRLTFRLNGALIDQAGKKSASVFGSVNREFDGFFDGRW